MLQGMVTHTPDVRYQFFLRAASFLAIGDLSQNSKQNALLIQLDFFKPFSAHNTVEFNLAVQGAGTQLDWAMYGPSPYVSRLMGLVFNMDKLIGGDFERGLANIQAALQSQAPAQP